MPENVLFGIRPEEVSLSAETGMARGRLERAELIGAEAMLEISLGNDKLTLRTPVQGVPETGSHVTVNFDLSRARLFHPQSGKALEWRKPIIQTNS